MIKHLLFIIIGNQFLLFTSCLIISEQRSKEFEEICIENDFGLIVIDDLRLCYMNNNRDRSILVWFSIDDFLFDIFHFYRFTLRTIDVLSLSTANILLLTNFTELIDVNNTLIIFNLSPGLYEVCVDFQSNSTSYIYSPRHGCISIRRGEIVYGSFRNYSAQLLISLIGGILIFLIAGLIVQWVKTKRMQMQQQISDDKKDKLYEVNKEQRFRSSTMISSTLSTKQDDQLLKKSFSALTDRLQTSAMQQWARTQAFRHRASIQASDVEWLKLVQQSDRPTLIETKNDWQENGLSSDSATTTNDIFIKFQSV